MSFWNRFSSGFAKSREAVTRGLQNLVKRNQPVAVSFEELEDVLLSTDMGAKVADRFVAEIRARVSGGAVASSEQVRHELKSLILAAAEAVSPLDLQAGERPRPEVILFVGVNGAGKTTSMAKLASRYQRAGKRVLLAAGDTFRAAAIEQLQTWGARLNIDVIHQQAGSDPAAVAFDAVNAATVRGADVLLVDSAGRLHTKQSLMAELIKVRRVIAKALTGAPHQILLVLDASTGQNALAQARAFHDALGVTGIILTKLDGTAKGGIVVAILEELRIPIAFVGLGEDMESLVPFDPVAFADALLGTPTALSPSP